MAVTMRRLRLVTLALVVASCGSPPPSAQPATSAPSPTATGTPTTGSATAVPAASASVPPSAQESGAPGALGGSSEGPAGSPAPQPPVIVLPVATMTDPFAIGEALYDPNRVPDAVVSMLDLMGVGIVKPDGTPARPGHEPRSGAPWLYDVEVQSMIDRTVDELVAAGDAGPEALPFTIGDIYDTLAPALPGASRADVVNGYTSAYASHPGALVPRLFLGQPIDGSTRLSSAQAWLLLMDGFVGPSFTVGDRGGVVLAASHAPAWGTATTSMPQLDNLAPMTEEDMRELLPHLELLVACIEWDLFGAIVHEGHRMPGTPVNLIFRLDGSLPIMSSTTHRPLIEQVNGGSGDLSGLNVTWRTDDAALFSEHGAFDRQLPATTSVRGDGLALITYTPRQEPANGIGELFTDQGVVEPTVPVVDLVQAFYRMPAAQLQRMLSSAFTGGYEDGTLRPAAQVAIGWHAPGLALTIQNDVDVELDAGVGFEGKMSRKGVDTLTGSLSRRSDGSYAGVMTLAIHRAVKMDFTVPLAAGGCEGTTDTKQAVYVVGTRAPAAIHPTTDDLRAGAFGSEDLVLRVYPVGDRSAPPVWCEDMLPWTGKRTVDGRTVKPALIPVNDLRWTTPGALRVHLPAVGAGLSYVDTSGLAPRLGFNSTWEIEVDRGE